MHKKKNVIEKTREPPKCLTYEEKDKKSLGCGPKFKKRHVETGWLHCDADMASCGGLDHLGKSVSNCNALNLF